MTKLYHKSNPYYRQEIAKNGLLPMIGNSYRAYYDGIPKRKLKPLVFMYDRNVTEYNSTYDDDIWEIDIKQLNCRCIKKDMCPTLIGCYIYNKPIPTSAIKLIYKGSGKSIG